MPYIKDSDRIKYESAITEIVNELNTQGQDGFYPVGDLNYLLSAIINQTLTRQGVRYQNLNALIGVLECAKLELYRRVAAPYEDLKIMENGDVYTSE
jgi:hypothetical protein